MEAKHPIRHILLIEDDRDDGELFEEVVHQIDPGIQLTILDHCNSILQVIAGLESLPHLIFLDVNLPGKDGIECIEELKAHPFYNQIRIIVYCGVITKTMMDKALSKGADLCFSKPSSLKEVHDLLEQLIRSD